MSTTDCAKCEQLLQPFVDRALTEREREWVQVHLDACPGCAKCYRLEETLRKHMRNCCEEQVTRELAQADLRSRLAALRTPLD